MEAEIQAAAAHARRDRASIRLIAVSKTQPVAAIRSAHAAGIDNFGENYLQEAVPKIVHCADMQVTWHYIGAIQSNKTRVIAENFDWVHTIDREKIARRLNDQCPGGKRLNVCLQVNVDADPNKAGVRPQDVAQLLAAAADLENLAVRGLMTILHPDTEPEQGYQRLQQLFQQLASSANDQWDTLSMGMSGDYVQAIAAGATCIRVGTAIFGPRILSNQ